MINLLPDFIANNRVHEPDETALVFKDQVMSYRDLDDAVTAAARGFLALGLGRGERVAVFLPKQMETVVAIFGASRAGGVFVPVNPALKARQVAYILKDCNVRILVTSSDRLRGLVEDLRDCPDLRHVILVDSGDAEAQAGRTLHHWTDLVTTGSESDAPFHRVIDADMTAILYTSGSTGLPKGVVLSHRNMVAGAQSVASYLENSADDVILSVLPLSFDAGLSQLTTAFSAGARVVLMNYLLPRDVIRAVARHKITGLTCVPPLWVQLADLEWPEEARMSLRYVASTGGRMPKPVVQKLRDQLPDTQVIVMYGLTEAFRSTYLPHDEWEKRPDSMGKAIPNAEIMVVRENGEPCAPGEVGELVHRGALVAMGYWNDPERTAERFRPAPGQPAGIPVPEIAVWSGDRVRKDEDGYLYFVGRKDEMIKTSGYRVSPTELEETLYASGLVGEAVALGVDDMELGQAIVVVVTPKPGKTLDPAEITAHCRRELPSFMVPHHVIGWQSLPRNPNGKLDRKAIGDEIRAQFADAGAKAKAG
ncbi:MAG: acyl-CoA ligase (AMP-forming), exosortase A system-associated [Alphaproteobacteria bacterium]|nr:MAG: acyl-CoA ligase (AMP-forming), exosortase A system-associated [Alphaproteobacteria bacterium]